MRHAAGARTPARARPSAARGAAAPTAARRTCTSNCQPVRRRELAVAPQRRARRPGRPSSTARSSRPQATPKYSAVRIPSAVSGRQWPAESPTKNTPSSTAGAQPVRDPVALEAHRVGVDVGGQRQRRVLHVQRAGRTSRRRSAARRAPGTTSRSRGRCSGGRATARGRRRGRRDGPRARARAAASGGWTFAPAPSTRRQPSASTISPARSRRRGRCARRCPCGRRPSRSRTRASPLCSHSSAHSVR